MIKIALVDDDQLFLDKLHRMLEGILNEQNIQFQITEFTESYLFLQNYKGEFDLLILDIDMPLMSGLELAQKVREKDSTVHILFVTTLGQYAIRGYEVDAIGFVVKPVSAYALKLNIKKVLARQQTGGKLKVQINTKRGYQAVYADDITYVEVQAHHLIYHTNENEISAYGNLSEVEKQLGNCTFSRCSSSYLLNLKYVTKVASDTAFIGDKTFVITRTKKKQFVEDFLTYHERK